MENSNLFCLEAVNDIHSSQNTKIFDFLGFIALEYDITNVYQTCDTLEGLEQSLNNLLYEDRNFKDYEIIFLVFSGSGNEIEIDNYFYSLEEIAELFEGKLKGKIIHFANSKTLDIDLETAQYFIDVTGAKALSGYTKKSMLDSLSLDSKLFEYYQQTDVIPELVEMLLDKHKLLCQTLGFRLFY